MAVIKTLIEALEELLAILSYPLGHIIHPPISNGFKTKQTILIVERWFNTNGLHHLWVNYLIKKGFTVHMVNFPIYRGSFEESAYYLKKYVEKYRLKQFVLVGISGGGLTAYLFCSTITDGSTLSNLLALAHPFPARRLPFLFRLSLREESCCRIVRWYNASKAKKSSTATK